MILEQALRFPAPGLYRTYINNYISPALGNEYIADLNYEKILQFLNNIDKSTKYKKHIYTCLRAMLEDARRSGYIAQLPESIKFDLPRKTIEWLPVEQQEAILAKIPPGHRYIFKFIFLTGVRPSEARALRKKDIKKDHIVIAKTFSPEPGGQALKIVKNKKEQSIPLYAAVVELLKTIPANLTPFVFINPDFGRPYTKNINRDYWNPACKSALGYVFPLNNAGRHSFGNQLLEEGVDIETVSALIRHSSTAITKENYARPKLKVMGGVVDRIQNGKKQRSISSKKNHQ